MSQVNSGETFRVKHSKRLAQTPLKDTNSSSYFRPRTTYILYLDGILFYMLKTLQK